MGFSCLVRLFLCGLMGAGKTTVGARLAVRLGLPFFDLDQEIERRSGQSIDQMFALEGEPGFRTREAAALEWACALPAGVVALGGGALCAPKSLERVLGAGRLVWLDAPTKVLVERVRDSAGRPLLGKEPAQTLDQMRKEREEGYARAHLHLEVGDLSADEAVDRVFAWLRP